MILELIQSIWDIFMKNPYAQTLGFIWYALSIYAFWFCKNTKFIKAMAVLSIFWAAHFYLIWALSAFIVNFIDIFKSVFALKYGKNKKIAFGFFLTYLIAWYFFFENIISFLPIWLAIFWLYLTFFVRWVFLNFWYLIIVCLWFIYNFHHASLGWMISDITLFFTGIYGIMTMFILKKKK